MSPATPTTVHGVSRRWTRICWPMGSAFGQMRWAKVSEITMTAGESCMSDSRMPRPRVMGTRPAAK